MKSISFIRQVKAASVALLLSGTLVAQAGVIVSPISGVINIGGPGFGSLNNTFDQNGLSTGFTSGATDFSTYIAGNPTHTTIFSGYEWFSNDQTNSASVTYNLGSVLNISQLALWNEETSGIGKLDLFGSADNVSFTSLGSFSPTDNPLSPDYAADVFSFATTPLQFVRFDMSGCPQANPADFNACAIGEVAFNSVTAVPESETYALMLAGLGLVGFMARRKARTTAV